MMVMLQRFYVQLTSDRKRFGMLCVVVAAGLLLWARLIIVSKVPRTAVAEPDTALQAEALDEAEATGDDSDNRPREVVKITLPNEVSRDPFLINRHFFPKPSAQTSTVQEVSKLAAEPVENPEQEKARRLAQLRASIERFSLDAAMTGAGMAVINGKLYRVNDMVPTLDNPKLTFKLTAVHARSVVLSTDHTNFELAMDAPGSSAP